MIKFVLKIVKKILVFALLIVVLLLVAINIPFNFYAKKVTTEDYSNWMVETLFDDQLVIDIAMLGAHDAFTNKINYGSNIDFASASGIQTGIPGALIKGFSVKQSKTQVSDVAALLKHGIRYFDIRLTYNDREAEWYTSHTYFSEPFANILDSIVEFLAENPGEFLILDIQHVNGVEYDDQVQFDSLSQMMTDSGIFDFAYEEGSIPLDAAKRLAFRVKERRACRAIAHDVALGAHLRGAKAGSYGERAPVGRKIAEAVLETEGNAIAYSAEAIGEP